MIVLWICFGAIFTLASAFGFGRLLLRGMPAPPEIALASGVALQSVFVFLIIQSGRAGWPAFLALGAVGIPLIFAGRTLPSKIALPAISRTGALVLALFAAYTVFYFVNALAPETWVDAYTYHLAMPADYLRLGGFPDRVRFYDMIPQGMEMLFTMAFAFGGASAARLVEFGLFLSGVPLIFRLGARLGLSRLASLLVAAFYFTAPIFALTGSSGYNDAALVVFTLAAFYLLLAWREDPSTRYVFAAGLAAGFCYAIKFPGIFTILAAACFLAAQAGWKRGARTLPVFAIGAAVCPLPWLLHTYAATGNPFAPLMNSLFPNPYFPVADERALSATMRSWNGIPAWRVPFELAFGGHLAGTYGPLLLLLPLGLLALRRRAARWCLAGAAILAIAWVFNTGARFLMPAAIVAMFAAAMPLPRAVLWAAIAVQAVTCWPQALDLWHPAYFRLYEFPWRAALRIEPEADYLRARVPEYSVAEMVERSTPPDAHIFSLPSVAAAYLTRDVLVRWHSAEGSRIFAAFQMAFIGNADWFFDWHAEWPAQPLRALRFRMPAAGPLNFDCSEVRLFNGADRIPSDARWALEAWPNVWDAPLAFDGLRTTRWSSGEPARPGMFLQVDFAGPQPLTAVTLLSHTPLQDAPLEIWGQTPEGAWRLLSRNPRAVRRPTEDLRLEATTVMRRAGFRYLLVNTDPRDSLGPLGSSLANDAAQWGLEPVAHARQAVLLRVW